MRLGLSVASARRLLAPATWALGLALATTLTAGPARAAGEDPLEAFDLEQGQVVSLDLPRDAAPHEFVDLTLSGQPITLTLFRSSVRADDFQVLTPGPNGELEPQPAPPVRTYRGMVLGERGSKAAASLDSQGLTAWVRLEEQVWVIQPLAGAIPDAPQGAHVVYSADDVIPGPWICGVDDPIGREIPGDAIESPAGSPDVAEIAFDADFEYFQANQSSVANTVADIESILNAVDAIYVSDVNITHELTTVIVRDDPDDPYTTNDPSGLLSQFQQEWNSNQTGVFRDVAHLMTGKNLSGSVIGIAGLGGVCSSFQGFGLSQSKFTNNFTSRVGLTAHELGHNWGANHCNGANPCNIMCSGLGGCSGNLSSFSPTSQSVIEAFAANASCVNSVPTTAVWQASVTTDDGDPVVDPGEIATITLSLDLVTQFDAPLVGLAATIFDTLANGPAADKGQIVGWQVLNDLDFLTGDFTQTDGDSLFNTNAGQITSFGPFTFDNPIDVLEFQYQPNEFDGSVVAYTTDTSDLLVWEGTFEDPSAEETFLEEVAFDIQLGVGTVCPADCNDDGELNVLDFTCFQGLFSAGDLQADCTGDGILNILDFTCFQAAFSAGCP